MTPKELAELFIVLLGFLGNAAIFLYKFARFEGRMTTVVEGHTTSIAEHKADIEKVKDTQIQHGERLARVESGNTRANGAAAGR